ncbi:rhodanese-like domain-containing protein [Chelatococcus asaccharovorans]|uniref:Rhodanese-related sulfurtransferase n=1 Tax=Chelatococcus asaccharovorans TaxID=28210 RepID=A0A2V3U610_9HYPH|nr:rhodanese-like domain-containing protein [Chelatococcus asaccharovorans]MBS7703768.1 thiosulfate sulfurtransferase [Chelatococcus asaccharovorans]PXW57928.1 rhodanese-related sulfurtransferase [Chelatococcus asaccharovorans]
MTIHIIDPAILSAWLGDGRELAVIDLRNSEEFGKGEPLYATNIPAARLLIEISRFVPRRVVRTVLVDGGDGIAARLTSQLAAAGWTDIHALDGGIPAWLAGTGVVRPTFDEPGVSFSVRVRDAERTPVLTVADLAALRAAGDDHVVLDSRTVEEFAIDHVPGAIAVPGAELVLRFADLVPSPDTRVVISCAGLPRAILGAQTLIDAGVPNPVAYLHDGTRAWRDAGWSLETGLTRSYAPQVSDAALRLARQRADALSARDATPEVNLAAARAWQADQARTTYLLDVRTLEEYSLDHLPETLSAPGGQLLGVAFRTLAVRHARVVLIDDLVGARAAVTAHWLRRRGFEIAILRHPFADARSRAVA